MFLNTSGDRLRQAIEARGVGEGEEGSVLAIVCNVRISLPCVTGVDAWDMPMMATIFSKVSSPLILVMGHFSRAILLPWMVVSASGPRLQC